MEQVQLKEGGVSEAERAPVRLRFPPLSPWLFILRNPGRTFPLGLVLLLAVLTIAGVIALLNSIDRTILKIYDYNRYFAAITPRGSERLDPALEQLVRRSPLVGEIFTTNVCFMTVQTIVGKMPFVIFGLRQPELPRMAAYCQLRLAQGRYPAPGAPEVILSEPLLKNKNLKIGDILLSPLVPDQYAPVPARIVGVLKGETWLALTSYEFVQAHFYPPLENLLVFAKEARKQPALDRWISLQLKGKQARVWIYQGLVEETQRSFRNLYFIIRIVVLVISLMLAIMMGLLSNIYFQQRVVEFGLLQAIGLTRRSILKRVSMETTVVVLLGWTLGLILTFGVLTLGKAYVMAPRGLYLEPLDSVAYRYTIPVPVMMLLFAIGTIAWRLRRFDPVAIVERRIV